MCLQYKMSQSYIILTKIFYGIEKVTYTQLYIIKICFQRRKKYKNIKLYSQINYDVRELP